MHSVTRFHASNFGATVLVYRAIILLHLKGMEDVFSSKENNDLSYVVFNLYQMSKLFCTYKGSAIWGKSMLL